MALSNSQVLLVAFFCAIVLWGAYTMLMVVIVFALSLSSRKMNLVHKLMFGLTFLMYAIASACLAIFFASNLDLEESLARTQASVVLGDLQFILNDIAFMWRVWALWERNYYVIMPQFILLCVSMGFGFQLADNITHDFNPHNPHTFPTISAALITANTILNTLLLVGRLEYMRWKIRRAANGTRLSFSDRRYSGITMIFIESGAIITAVQVVSFILSQKDSPAQRVVLNMLPQLVGLLVSAMILLIHLDLVPGSRYSESYAQTRTSNTLTWAVASSSGAGEGTAHGSSSLIASQKQLDISIAPERSARKATFNNHESYELRMA